MTGKAAIACDVLTISRSVSEQCGHMATRSEPWYWVLGEMQMRNLPYNICIVRWGIVWGIIRRITFSANQMASRFVASYIDLVLLWLPTETPKLSRLKDTLLAVSMLPRLDGWRHSRLYNSALISAFGRKENSVFHIAIPAGSSVRKKHFCSKW
jgi:hypothetical protein